MFEFPPNATVEEMIRILPRPISIENLRKIMNNLSCLSPGENKVCCFKSINLFFKSQIKQWTTMIQKVHCILYYVQGILYNFQSTRKTLVENVYSLLVF
jgi:hypothetical protein